MNLKIKRCFRLPYMPIILAPLILFSPLWLTGKVMFWGTPSLQFVPWWTWAWDTLLAGHLPLWNPLVGMGAPLLANYQSALFYPPTWIYFFLYLGGGLITMARGQALLTALHLIWAGIGMARLVERLELSKLAQAISGLAFSLSGYLVARAWFSSINSAAAWLPWVLLFSYDVIMGKSKKSWVKLSVVIGLQLLAGHAQTVWYTLTLAGLWVGFWVWQKSNDDHMKLHTFETRLNQLVKFIQAEVRLAMSVLLGASLAAVQLLPTAVYLAQSQRSESVAYDVAMTYSFWPWRLLSLIAPDLFGNPVRGDYWGYGNYWEDAIYIGLLPFMLVLFIVGRSIFLKRRKLADNILKPLTRSWRSLILFLFGISVLSLLLALGDNTPVFPWFYRHLPTFNMFQAPTRFTIWAQFSLAFLAGLGVFVWRRPEKKALYWTRLGTMGAFAVTLGSGLTLVLIGDIQLTFIRATTVAGFFGISAGVLSLLAPEKHQLNNSQRWAWAVVIFVAADLLIAGWGLTPDFPSDLYNTSDKTTQGRIYLSAEDEHLIKFEKFFRFDTFTPDLDWNIFNAALLPNANMLVGAASTNNYDPLVPGRYARWMNSLEDLDESQLAKMLDLMGVTVFEKISETEESDFIFINRGTQTTLRWVPCSIFVQGADQAWEQVLSNKINFNEIVVLEGQISSSPLFGCSSPVGKVKYESTHPNQKIIHSKSDQAGWVVVSDVWYPGWQAWIDGEKVPLLKANYLFRAVEVGIGEHEIILKYQPKEFYFGFLVSLVSWLFVFYFYRLKN